MPEERNNPAPTINAAEWEEAKEGIPREMAAARLIASRRISGIPFRPYLTGDCDTSPVVRAVADYAGLVYDLLDALDSEPSDVGHSEVIMLRVHRIRAAMEAFHP